MTKGKNETPEEREKRLEYHREYSRNLTEEQRERVRKRTKEWHRRKAIEDPGYAKQVSDRCLAKPENREKNRARARKYKASLTPEQRRDLSFKKHHGVTRDEADARIEAQGGLCAICEKPPRGKASASRLHVDHDHETGEIRAMLCTQCNRTLGLVGEDVGTLHRMIEYLSKAEV